MMYGKILTKEDWEAYKIKFEQQFPEFIYRLRGDYKAMTEGEERLFLLIRSNLKSIEIARILGVSPPTVKKSRQRLRKRLNLNADVDLEEFIHAY